MTFGGQLLSRIIMFPGFICVACVSVFHSFLWLKRVPLSEYTALCLSNCHLADRLAVLGFWGIINKLLYTFTCTLLCGRMFSFSLGVYIGMELLAHVLILHLAL